MHWWSWSKGCQGYIIFVAASRHCFPKKLPCVQHFISAWPALLYLKGASDDRYVSTWKLDRLAPLITDPPSSSFYTLSKKKKIVTSDIWHVTHDTWHMTHDMWHMTGGGRWTFSQNASSLALTVWEWRRSEDISTKDHWVSQSVS